MSRSTRRCRSCSGRPRERQRGGAAVSARPPPLAPHRADFTVFSGLHHPNGIGQAHVCADTWLTGAKIDAQSARKYENTISCDQVMAEVTALVACLRNEQPPALLPVAAVGFDLDHRGRDRGLKQIADAHGVTGAKVAVSQKRHWNIAASTSALVVAT